MEDEHRSNEKLTREVEILRKQITDLEKSTRYHEKREEHLSYLASFPESNPNPVLEVDSSGNFLFVNSAAKTLFPDLGTLGRQHSWFQGWNSLWAFGEDSPEDSWTREIPIGSDWFEQRIYRNRERKSLRFYGFNITDRKRAEGELLRIQSELEKDVKARTARLETATKEFQEEIGGHKLQEKLSWAFNEVNAVIHSTLNSEEIINRVIITAAKAIDCESAAVSLREDDQWIVRYVYGLPQSVIGNRMNDDEERHALLAIKTKKSVLVHDALDDERVNREHLKKWGIHSVLVVPLIAENQAIGALFFNQHTASSKFMDSHLDFANQLAFSLSLAIQNAHLFERFQGELQQRIKTEEALRHSESRLKLLSETAGRLLATADPQGAVNELCRDVMVFLDCQAFFNFLVDEKAGRLRLNAFGGIPEEDARKIEWLDYGAAVCGCAAREGIRIVATDIFNIPDPRTDLVKSYGIQAYACHPLLVGDQVIGTLSFGTRTRTNFAPEELAIMKTISDQIAIAMERIKLLEDLRRSRDELELKVQERTRDLAKIHREMMDQSRILEGFFAATITPIVLLDKDFNFIHVNEAYAKGSAMEASEFQGWNYFELFPHEENEAIFRSVVETKRPYRAVAKPLVFPDHPEWETTYWDWILTPVLDEKGQVEYLVFSLNDVTEQVKVQEKVRKNEELLRNVLENLPVGVWVTDREGKMVQGNPAGERIWGGFRFAGGQQERDYKGRRLSSGKEMTPQEWGAVRAITKGETTLNEEVEIECQDGTRKVILNFAIPFRNDRQEITGAIIVNQDITARKKAEGELRVASLYARSLIEASLDPLVTIGADGKIMDVNGATELMTGVNREDLIGSDFSKYFTEPERAREGYRKVFEEGMVRDYPLALRHIAGGVADVLYNATLFKNEAGELQGVFAAARDITGKKKAEEALRESENQLRILSAQLLTAQENERKRVSRELHDGLQQTLTAIKFKVEAFLLGMNKTHLKEKAKTLEPIVSMIQESVKEIRRIQADLRPPMLDDLGILASLAWLFREFQGTYSDIRVERAFQVEERDIPEKLKMVIYRILQEALNNIGKHSGAERVSVSLRKMENLIELGIRDNGRGFNPQDDLSKEQKEKGMGLASMKERVESSGGFFAVQSQRGEGTLIQASWGL